MKKLTMHFVGIKKVKITSIGPVRLSSDKFRSGWLEKVKTLGSKGS